MAIEGALKEVVTLDAPLSPKLDPPQWVAGLEAAVRNALGAQLQACLATRLQGGKFGLVLLSGSQSPYLCGPQDVGVCS